MKIEDQFKAWDDAHDDAKQQVEYWLSKDTAHPDTADFVHLAKWCLTTEIIPDIFMPTGYERSFHSSSAAAGFLNTLHHAMVDDGCLIFVEYRRVIGSFVVPRPYLALEFCEPHEINKIPHVERTGIIVVDLSPAEFIEIVERREAEATAHAAEVDAKLAALRKQRLRN